MRKYRILIVENDEDELFFMKESFNESGLFDIIGDVKNGNTLFEWLSGKPAEALPDLILSDLNMPGKNGYDILAEIRENEHYAHIPVVITSTSSIKSVMEKCLQMGASDYLVKPESFIDYSSYAKDLYYRCSLKVPD
ncbi:response regulator [Dyadobacter flavalbus]|uniref:Response regulator n=1 Tax=Dyadobacter flavalbus TaxID=2579942 RepID=A0A5M8QV20_9BACT|nr:response regulator [Dyadobacter flavalbus]KAA6438283.1 response regulator [Dyadobacter flavalbus]